jgi:predicted metal-dependent hydrolase
MVKRVRIYDLDIEYQAICRDVKYPRLEFKTGGLVLILPKGYQKEAELIDKHKDWVYKKSSLIRMAIRQAKTKEMKQSRSEEELKRLINRFANKYSSELKVSIKEIRFRKLKSKWGSCSSRGSLTFNMLLRYLPEDLVKYVVLHETVHLIERNHKDRFWDTIGHYFKNYKNNERRLFLHWFQVQEFLRKKE